MSNRTSRASKAIAEAWKNERELVLRGMGTRDWTPEQQEQLINRGKVYDSDGKAFEGHHMLNVENHPELQENPDNIQFLSRAEHLQAHDGNFQNPTNGYYNPDTGETVEFSEETGPSRDIIMLSSPVYSVENTNTQSDNLVNETVVNTSDISVESRETETMVNVSIADTGTESQATTNDTAVNSSEVSTESQETGNDSSQGSDQSSSQESGMSFY